MLDCVAFLHLDWGINLWPINTECIGDDGAIFRVNFSGFTARFQIRLVWFDEDFY